MFAKEKEKGKGAGRVKEQGTPEEFFANHKDERLKEFLSKVL